MLNDFAAGVEELDAQIAAVPNLVVLLSTGPDERSWASPEWGASAFMHFAMVGLNGGADLDGNKRVTAGELAAYLTPRVSDWVRDNRAARQVPLLLPKGDGEARANAMHLVSVDGQPGASAAPVPFEPPPELEAQWKEYRELANATPPPTAYTPHLWRQYEAWTLRHEELILANDTEGAKLARASAGEVRRKIEAARMLDIAPQTLTLQAAVGGQPYVAAVPARIKQGMDALGAASAANRAKVWADERAATGDTEPTRLLWCRALIEWVATDPVPRLPVARDLIPLITDGLPVRPAEVNFLAALAKHLPPPDKKDIIGPLLTRVLRNRSRAEEAAAGLGREWVDAHPEVIDEHHRWDYPFVEFVYPWLKAEFVHADGVRRSSEDQVFSTEAAAWAQADNAISAREWRQAVGQSRADTARRALVAWQSGAHFVLAESEWAAREAPAHGGVGAFAKQIEWSYLYQLAGVPHQPPVGNPEAFVELYRAIH
ncbi:MAG: hypothetical protein FJ304_19660 [Planctomycetes bacterium]|nr:hypothetical protein [Planctomycetota bacterium]